MVKNGAEILIDALVEQGVDTIFGYPGGAVLNIYDALYKNSDRIRHILTAHEQGAAHAADGYARATGKVGVCLATSGPGATNLVTGIATAYMDSIPMVAITGNVGTSLIGRDSFQEVYIAGITMPITKHNFVVRDVEELADTVRDAFRIAASGRPGPVLIDIPKDITAAKCEFIPKGKVEINETYEISDEELQTVADMIAASERPMIYYGGGVETSDAGDMLLQLQRKADIPSAHTMMAIGCIPDTEPLSLGMIGMHGTVSAAWAVERCDLLVCIGARFSDRVATNTKRFAPSAKVIHVDIDNAEINKNIGVDYAIVSDAETFLEKVMPYIKEAKHDAWRAQITEWQTKLDYVPKDDESVIHPHQLLRTVAEETPEDTIIATDVGQHQLWSAQYNGRKHVRQFLTSGGLGTMGFGYGAALGAQVAFPDRTVVHITGDGSFRMNLTELSTIGYYGIPVIVVIFNNGTLGMVRQWQTLFFGHRYSQTTLDRGPDFMKLAAAYGLSGARVNAVETFAAAFKAAVEKREPCIIECMLDIDEMVAPMVAPGSPIDSFCLN